MKRNDNQTLDQQIEQARQRFHELCESPRPETMKRLLVLTPDALNSVVESQVGALAEDYTEDTPLALAVQLFVRISRQFPQLPGFVVVDVVVRLGHLYAQRDAFVEALEHMEML